MSKKTEHTPGPWIVDDRHVHRETGLTYPNGQEPETDLIVLIDTDCHCNGLLNETDKANLRLIASAPDLLAALEECLGFMDRILVGHSLGDIKTENQARAAIAKAKGQP